MAKQYTLADDVTTINNPLTWPLVATLLHSDNT